MYSLIGSKTPETLTCLWFWRNCSKKINSVRANPKSGIDVVKFKKYLTNKITPFCLDAKKKPRNHAAGILLIVIPVD